MCTCSHRRASKLNHSWMLDCFSFLADIFMYWNLRLCKILPEGSYAIWLYSLDLSSKTLGNTSRVCIFCVQQAKNTRGYKNGLLVDEHIVNSPHQWDRRRQIPELCKQYFKLCLWTLYFLKRKQQQQNDFFLFFSFLSLSHLANINSR